MNDEYLQFLKAKMCLAKRSGIEIDDSEINPIAKPHQRDIIRWAIAGGQRAIFASFGLGKSLMQLEICRIILKHKGGRGLIVCPLGVRGEFMRDAKMLGIKIRFIKSDEEIAGDDLYITNYESVREGKLNPTGFIVVSLDEASCLRGFGSTKTFREMMKHFEGTSTFRFVATACPDPNEFLELLSYSAFLGVLEVSQGKAQPLDAKVLTPNGWKLMGEISIGDKVIGDDGNQTNVVGVYPQGDKDVYRVTFSDGSSTECCDEHLWMTQTQQHRDYEGNQQRQPKRVLKRGPVFVRSHSIGRPVAHNYAAIENALIQSKGWIVEATRLLGCCAETMTFYLRKYPELRDMQYELKKADKIN